MRWQRVLRRLAAFGGRQHGCRPERRRTGVPPPRSNAGANVSILVDELSTLWKRNFYPLRQRLHSLEDTRFGVVLLRQIVWFSRSVHHQLARQTVAVGQLRREPRHE